MILFLPIFSLLSALLLQHRYPLNSTLLSCYKVADSNKYKQKSFLKTKDMLYTQFPFHYTPVPPTFMMQRTQRPDLQEHST